MNRATVFCLMHCMNHLIVLSPPPCCGKLNPEKALFWLMEKRSHDVGGWYCPWICWPSNTRMQFSNTTRRCFGSITCQLFREIAAARQETNTISSLTKHPSLRSTGTTVGLRNGCDAHRGIFVRTKHPSILLCGASPSRTSGCT